jgi:cytochrome P450 family 72 subfamily A61
VILTEPELIKDVTLKNYHYPKVPPNPLARLLVQGVSSLERDEWAKHRKIISAAFHLEKLKVFD